MDTKGVRKMAFNCNVIIFTVLFIQISAQIQNGGTRTRQTQSGQGRNPIESGPVLGMRDLGIGSIRGNLGNGILRSDNVRGVRETGLGSGVRNAGNGRGNNGAGQNRGVADRALSGLREQNLRRLAAGRDMGLARGRSLDIGAARGIGFRAGGMRDRAPARDMSFVGFGQARMAVPGFGMRGQTGMRGLRGTGFDTGLAGLPPTQQQRTRAAVAGLRRIPLTSRRDVTRQRLSGDGNRQRMRNDVLRQSQNGGNLRGQRFGGDVNRQRQNGDVRVQRVSAEGRSPAVTRMRLSNQRQGSESAQQAQSPMTVTARRGGSNGAGSTGNPRTNANPPLFTMCARPRSVRCYAWPRNQDPAFAYRCDAGCPGGECIVPCQCSCVDRRIIPRLRMLGRIRGREFRPIDPRLWQSFEPLRPAAGSGARPATPTSRLRPQRPAVPRLGISGQNNSAINFGITDDVLATLIAQPDLNNLVGPQGINQIIAGEPPLILPSDNQAPLRAEVQQVPPGNTSLLTSLDATSRLTSLDAASILSSADLNMGIPVPMNRLDIMPLPQDGLSAQDLRMAAGMNIDLPAPMTPLNGGMDRSVTVEEIPGTGALFVDLSINNQHSGVTPGRSQALRSMPETMQLPSRFNDNVRSLSPVGSRSFGISDTSTPTITVVTRPMGDPGIAAVGSRLSDMPPVLGGQGRTPTKDECISQQRELWCDPVEPWDGTPGVARWCILNCRSDNCDSTRCACRCISETLFRLRYGQIDLRAP